MFYARLRALVGSNEYERIRREDGAGRIMAAKVWSRLPDDILQLVLCRLPLRSKHRFRCVSKHWEELLLTLASASQQGCDGRQPQLYGISFVAPTATGTQVATAAAGHESWEEETSDEELSVCADHEEEEMVRQTPSLRLDLSFLPPEFQRWNHSQCALDSGWVVVMYSRNFGPLFRPLTHFCVFNPVTRNWRQLPTLSYPFPETLHDATVHVDGDHGLQLVAALECDRIPVFARFSANTNAWQVCSNLKPSPGKLPFDGVGMYRDVIYHLASGDCQEELFLHVFRMCEAGWEIVEAIPVPREFCTQKQSFVACHAGDPYIVLTEGYTLEVWTVHSRSDDGNGNTIAIWKYIAGVQLINYRYWWVDEVKVLGDYICFKISGPERTQLYLYRTHLYVYSISNDSWEVFPARFHCFTPTTEILR